MMIDEREFNTVITTMKQCTDDGDRDGNYILASGLLKADILHRKFHHLDELNRLNGFLDPSLGEYRARLVGGLKTVAANQLRGEQLKKFVEALA